MYWKLRSLVQARLLFAKGLIDSIDSLYVLMKNRSMLGQRTESVETWHTIEDVLGVCGRAVRRGRMTVDYVRLVVEFFIAITPFIDFIYCSADRY
jgi:hypothetical protein